MIQNLDVDQRQGRFQLGSNVQIALTGHVSTGRVIVRKDHGSGIDLQGAFDDFAGIDRGLIDGAGKQFFKGQYPVLIIEKQAPEGFVLKDAPIAPVSRRRRSVD